jgi:hypothetical protein
MRRIRSHLTYANVMATIAVFAAIGGGSAFALQGHNTVRSDDIVNRQVRTKDLHGDAVKSGKIADQQVRRADLRDSVVDSSKVLDGSLRLSEIAADSSSASTGIANLAANACTVIDPALADQAQPGDLTVLVPSAITAGISAEGMKVETAGTIRARFCNTTEAAKPASISYDWFVLRP